MTPSNADDAVEERVSATFKALVSDESFTFRTITFDDPVVTASQVAERFGASPASEFKVLAQLATGEIESKRPNETTDLREAGPERFFVVRSDRTFGFTVEGRSLEWPRAALPGAHLRLLALANDAQELARVTPDGFQPVEEDDEVTLDGGEVEEFRLVERPRTVTVFYREQPFELERRAWSTEELMQKFQVPAGYKLDLIQDDGEFKELKPGKSIKLREGMEFTSHVPAGQSS